MAEAIFTEHVRALLVGQFDDGQRVRSHLQAVICKELQRLGLWNVAPRFLGYTGASWSGSDALDDLVQDAYLVCIFKRLKRLAEYLQASGTIEGAVHWKLQRYLLDCQRHSNPARTRIFNNVKAASAALVARGQAETFDGSLLNSASLILALGETQPSSRNQLADSLAVELSDAGFVSVVSRQCAASRELIENTLLNKFASGLAGYQLGQVVQLLAEASLPVAELADMSPSADSGPTNFVADFLPDFRTLAPEGRYQQSEDFTNLLTMLNHNIQATIRLPRVQARVMRLLDYLAELIRSGEDLRSLTQAEIARRLGVSYATLNEDFIRLRTAKVMQLASEAES